MKHELNSTQLNSNFSMKLILASLLLVLLMCGYSSHALAHFQPLTNPSNSGFVPTIPGEKRGVVCSGELGSDFNECPSNFEKYAISKSQIPTEESECQSPTDLLCSEELVVGVKNQFVIFDIDREQTVKFEVLVMPNVFYQNGSLKQSGYIAASEIAPSADELEVTELFALVSRNRAEIRKKTTITELADGSMVDEDGAPSDFVLESADSCKTALDFLDRASSCAGDLSNDIVRGVEEEVLFYSTVNALEKLEVVLEVVLPTDIDLSSVEKLAEFNYIIKMKDGSILVVHVKVDGGAIEIKLDEDASRVSDGRTFRLASSGGVNHSTSFAEAEAIVSLGLPMSHCGNLQSVRATTEWVVAKRITIRQPDGTEQTRFIYRERTNLENFQVCYE